VRALVAHARHGLVPDEETLRQMREQAPSVRLVSGERIGGGLAADGMGELSRLLLGASPAKALRIARDTGVLAALVPEFAPAIGFDPHSPDHDLTLDEHVLAVVQAAAAAGVPLRVRLAALLHDLGKPEADRTGDSHAAVAAALASGALRRLRYPTRLRKHVVAIVAAHAYRVDGLSDPVHARRFLAEHGEGLAGDLIEHKGADLRAKDVPPSEYEALQRFRELVESERSSPTTLARLAVDGSDLIHIGFREGPELGQTLRSLLAAVVEDPGLNERETLLERARAELP
jgi:tRNA nucleotidyltransferase (CCA-adding enzyme)